jgi:hypothetical protein
MHPPDATRLQALASASAVEEASRSGSAKGAASIWGTYRLMGLLLM